MTSFALNTLGLAFTTAEKIERFDPAAFIEKVLNIFATLAAVAYGVTSYVITAFQCWWDTNGETVMVGAIRFTIGVADFAGGCYFAGRKLRPVANAFVANLTDRAYYLAAGY